MGSGIAQFPNSKKIPVGKNLLSRPGDSGRNIKASTSQADSSSSPEDSSEEESEYEEEPVMDISEVSNSHKDAFQYHTDRG